MGGCRVAQLTVHGLELGGEGVFEAGLDDLAVVGVVRHIGACIVEGCLFGLVIAVRGLGG
ncbi:MAG: hypothetical protein CL437_07890 [Acidimicrobiaceae bacterium]|nr:hypothetical protein [Acidimicrobiaceae bacterium]